MRLKLGNLLRSLRLSNNKITQSEAKFQAFIKYAGDTIFITDSTYQITEVNHSACKLLNYSIEEFKKMKIYELQSDDDQKLFATRIKIMDKAGGSLHERKFKRKDGSFVDTEVNLRPIEGVGHIAIVRDITERKRMEKELVESDIRFREVLENSLSASYKRNLQTNAYDYLSPVFEKITGYTQDEINNLPLETVTSMMHPDDVLVVKKCITKAITELNGLENIVEYRFKHKANGEYRWLKDEFVVMQDARGQAASFIGSVSDITERRKIETELIERREQAALFVEYSPASLAMFDMDMRYIATSRKWLTAYKLGDQQIIGKTHYEVFPEIQQDWKDIHQRCLKGEIDRREEDSFTRLDGTTDWLRWEIRPWHKASGEIGGIIMFTEVITALKESELTFKNLVEKSLVGVYIIQKEKFVYVNPKFAEYLGYTQEAMLNMDHYSQIVDPDFRPVDIEQWRKKVEAGIIEDFHSELKYRRKNGEIIWAEVYCGETLYKGAKAILGTFQDITERKTAEERLRQSEANYRQLFDNSPAPMWVIDEKTSAILQVNKACIQNYGFSEEEFRGMAISDISDPVLATKKDMNDILFMGSQRHVKKSGELIDVVTSSIPINLNGEKNILLTAIDVTEKNLYEQKLAKAAIKAQEDERYEIGGELHDNVCQILAGSLMCLGLMESSLPKQSMEVFNHTHKYINDATSEIRNLSHRLAPAFLDKQTLEEALIQQLKSFNADNRYTISLNVDTQFKKQPLNKDLQLNLYRIIQEQLRNITKHAKATKIELDISLKKNNVLQMKISDNGVGFNAKDAKDGIGLANMNRRVQLFSGTLTINSAVGKGCKVLAEIPLSSAR